jgi:hypothetical protein
VGEVVLAGDSTDDAEVLKAKATSALAASFGIDASSVTVALTFVPGEQGGRRLAAGTWTISYEIIATAASAALANSESYATDLSGQFAEQSLTVDPGTISAPTLEAVTSPSTDEPTDAPAPDPARGGPTLTAGTEGQTVAAREAESSSTVFILGIAAFVVLFLAVLIPTLCKRRIRALLGMKAPNANAAIPAVDEDNADRDHDWDVDNKGEQRHQTIVVDQIDGIPDAEAVENLGLSKEEAKKLGLIPAEGESAAATPVDSGSSTGTGAGTGSNSGEAAGDIA